MGLVDPERLLVAGIWFRAVASCLDDRADVLTEVCHRLRQVWSGPAAGCALERFVRLGQGIREASVAALHCDQVLCELADRVRLADSQLMATRHLTGAANTTAAVRTGPALGLPAAELDTDPHLVAAVRLADDADRIAATDLRCLSNQLAGGGIPGHAPESMPDPAASPGEVGAWWSRLAESEQRWLVAHRPDLVGQLDGVPAADRDAANRALLDEEHERLLQRRADLIQTSGTQSAIDQIDSRLAGVESLADRLADPLRPRAYLLAFTGDGDGQAVVAVGNPDHASDVLTYVPGTGSDLSGVAGLVDRADAVATSALRVEPNQRLSAITWLGYDCPDGVGAVFARAAHDAERSLDDFIDGLRVTHDGAPDGDGNGNQGTRSRAHHTVLGHSYGSLVVGVTARDRGLAADDLIFVGSPGVGVDRVTELGVSPDRVWSSTAANDPVQRYAPGVGQLVLDSLSNRTVPWSARYGDDRPDLLLWHGLNPSSAAFGGRIFTSTPDGGHSGYWSGAALDQITRIALGAAHPAAP